MKKVFMALFCVLLLSTASLPGISNIGAQKAEAASVVGKSHTYYLSKAQAKDMYRSMKKAEKYGGWASIVIGGIPGGQAAGIALALSASSVGQQEVEKAYHKNMRLKITYTYGVTMSTNKTTFKAVK